MSQVGTLQGPGKPPGDIQPMASPPLPLRRSRAVACAECRRLKLKCDRAFPCMNCRRRDVANLCPHGALITRPRVSHSTTNAEGTAKKHDVKWMLERIRRLEEALALVQSKVSDEPHPLLSVSARTDEYGSGSSEQPDSDPKSFEPIFYTADSLPDDKTGLHTDSADL